MLGRRLRWLSLLLGWFVLASSCAESTQHDENIAAKRAIEFAQVTLINKDFDQGYELLSAGGKRHISLDKFKETVTRLHSRGFPARLTANEYQPMPAENPIWIYLTGQNSQDQFQYRVTMESTGNGDYKVLTLDSGAVGRLFSPLSEKRQLANALSTQP